MHECVGIFVIHDNKKLLVKRLSNDEYWPGVWCFLAEHIKEGESEEEAVNRCLQEELGIEEHVEMQKKKAKRFTYNGEVFKVSFYKAHLKENPEIELTEASEYDWFYDLPFQDVFPNLREIYSSLDN
jgi:isopentenyldiphosphate isomerase